MPTTQVPPTRRLRGLAEVADYLGVSDKTIRRMIASGQLTAYRIGPRMIRLDLNEIELLLRPMASAKVG